MILSILPPLWFAYLADVLIDNEIRTVNKVSPILQHPCAHHNPFSYEQLVLLRQKHAHVEANLTKLLPKCRLHRIVQNIYLSCCFHCFRVWKVGSRPEPREKALNFYCSSPKFKLRHYTFR
ncbi:hypothetical protein AVEN_195256-1 [Araneus ventricosus]|uniref:Uncharacterized protein n=1 Tax=Araneus ventricosus TaxID=182803 RepID=A0A4Y2VC99_ARAVE|nr:hypothetical protein AVEN_195256-1 [Araneus ventricosus]